MCVGDGEDEEKLFELFPHKLLLSLMYRAEMKE